jgi:hypothetical protein
VIVLETPNLLGGPTGSATFSDDRRYRYALSRVWGDHTHICVFFMCNPSVADHETDDPTIRKCVGFARRWRFGGIRVANMFALVSTDVTQLLKAEDPVGPENDSYIAAALQGAHRVVWAWGKHSVRVAKLVAKRLESTPLFEVPDACVLGTLGLNSDGSPKHPLMLGYATQFQRNVRRLDR